MALSVQFSRIKIAQKKKSKERTSRAANTCNFFASEGFTSRLAACVVKWSEVTWDIIRGESHNMCVERDGERGWFDSLRFVNNALSQSLSLSLSLCLHLCLSLFCFSPGLSFYACLSLTLPLSAPLPFFLSYSLSLSLSLSLNQSINQSINLFTILFIYLSFSLYQHLNPFLCTSTRIQLISREQDKNIPALQCPR